MKGETEIIEEIRMLRRTVEDLVVCVERTTKEKPTLDDWITQKQAMALSGLSKSTLLKLRKAGEISSSTIAGKTNYYRLSDFKLLLDKNEKER